MVSGHVPIDRKTDPNRPRIPVDIDPASGTLAGTFDRAGTYPLLIAAESPSANPSDRNNPLDAIRVVLIVGVNAHA
jgi:hypothetical protein